MAPFSILVTIDANYIKPLKVMLKSCLLTIQVRIFGFFDAFRLNPAEVNEIEEYIGRNGHSLSEVKINDECFSDAPTLKHWTKEMYYRLLAFKYLPIDLDRILYLDPDILVINPIHTLYNTDLSGWMYAAAYHDVLLATEINRLRFRNTISKPISIPAYC